MKNLRRTISMLMVIIMLVSFGLSSIGNADAINIDTETEATYSNIKVSKPNGMEYRTIKDLDLREGNSNSHKSLAKMPKGSYVKHQGTTDNGWFKLDYNGRIGYAHRNDVTSKANYDKNYSDIEVSKPNGMEYRTIKDLDLREGNSNSHKSITKMPKGSYVKHQGTTNNGWFKLDYNGRIGYAHRTDVTSKENYDKNYSDIEVSKPNGMEYRTIKDLDLREGNSNSHKSIEKMPKGSYVKHQGTADNGWFKLDYNGTIGYAHRSDVTSKENYDKNYGDIVVGKPNGVEYRTIKDLDLREGNSNSHKSIARMPKGSYVKHQGTTNNGWFKLDYDGTIGYVNRADVTSQDNYTRNHDGIKVGKPNGKEYITVLDLHLRDGNAYSNRSKLVMPKGSYVKHLGTTDNGWFKLDYNGTIGYAHRDHVTESKPEVIPDPEPNGAMVFLDYGHGGTDPGAGAFGRTEKDDVLRLGLLVANNLRNSGVIVDESRNNDKTVSLRERTDMANQKSYDYFVSFHRNSNSGPRPGLGVETFTFPTSSSKASSLSEEVQKNLVGVGFHNRGTKQANFHVLRETKAPAILIEVGFINNENDNLIFDTKLNQMAKAISDGVLAELSRNK